MSTANVVDYAVNRGVDALAEPMETDEAFYEFIDGRRVEMPPMSNGAVVIASRIGFAINAFAKPSRLGEAIIELLIRFPIGEDESRERRPDVSFFCFPRSPDNHPQNPNARALHVIPDWAIEVTSPSDKAEAQREKVVEYFRAGVRLVWVVYPNLRIIDIYESATTVRVVGADDTVTGDPVLPGFQLPLAELFTPFAAQGL